LREQLDEIYRKHGRLTPELVVQVARPKDNPLHPRVFDRAPREAAEAWYRQCAHELIQSVRVVYREADESGPEKTVRAFHAVRGEAGYNYEPLDKVVADDLARAIVLRDMEREWRQLFARYEQFSEFVDMVRHDVEEAA
jgi:hypothetical protein